MNKEETKEIARLRGIMFSTLGCLQAGTYHMAKEHLCRELFPEKYETIRDEHHKA